MKTSHKVGVKILLWIATFLLSDIDDKDQKDDLKKLSTHISVNMDLMKD